MKAPSLAVRIASSIGRDIRDGRVPMGAHLTAQAIAVHHGVSRFLASEPLTLLVEQGFAPKEANRGEIPLQSVLA
ncbi:hypothetical protein [Mesorhizobium marinum]|uniref:hypothetical protein n=1 Tax=Mesorhizobium marinum TaxID=3228790 RepID=UPI00346799DC